MRRAVILILLLSLVFGSYGCNKSVNEKVNQPDNEVEKSAKIIESQLKLSDPSFVKDATPQQMKDLSEDLKKQ